MSKKLNDILFKGKRFVHAEHRAIFPKGFRPKKHEIRVLSRNDKPFEIIDYKGRAFIPPWKEE